MVDRNHLHDVEPGTPARVATDPAARRMQSLIDQWKAAGDQRMVFLRCYALMTANMLAAIDRQEFHDSAWVDRLLHRFAGYYFAALDAYEADRGIEDCGLRIEDADIDHPGEHPAGPPTAPPVWQLAFETARHPGTSALQNLLLGVNAHINYDLILALMDILEPEWASLTEEQRLIRYQDHCHVNRVIGQTIDAVQDEILDPEMPVMELIDKLMGRVDEALVSHLLSHWRDIVWHHAMRLLELADTIEADTKHPADEDHPGDHPALTQDNDHLDDRGKLIKHYEKEVIEIGEIIQMRRFNTL